MPIDVTSRSAFKKATGPSGEDKAKIILRRYIRDTYFQPSRGKFIHHAIKSGQWLILGKELFIDFLMMDGYYKSFAEQVTRISKKTGEKIKETTIRRNGWAALAHPVMSEKQVDAVMRGLAGIPEGYYEDNGCRCICTGGPTYITPVEGECPDVERWVSELLPGDQRAMMEELVVRMYELKTDPEGVFICQIPILVGDADCGKSLFKDEIFIPLLGGRHADCISFMTGDKFNGELAAADVWVIDDQGFDTRFDQDVFADRLKKFASDLNKRIEEKFQPAINLHIKPSMIVCLNTGSKNLRLLPDMGPDIEQKILGFLCGRMTLPTGADHMRKIRQTIKTQLPAYWFKLLHKRKPPKNIISEGRFGIAPFFHPKLQKMREAGDYAIAILEMLSNHVEINRLGNGWTKTAGGVFEAITDAEGGSPSRTALLNLCKNSIQLGIQLTKLARIRPEKVIKGKPGEFGCPYTFNLAPVEPDKKAKPEVRVVGPEGN